jgi:E3 ubiquitin-protein ligase MARCH6
MATDANPLMTGPLGDTRDTIIDAEGGSSYDTHTDNSRVLDKEEADTCRICRGEATADEPLFYPCKCSGSIKYVHQECLMEWLSHTQKKHCELCKTSFRFTKLYHPGMPNRIPTTVFIRRAALHVAKLFLTWCRAVLVASVWLLLLPWCMRVVWRSLFWVGDGGWAQDVFLNSSEATDTPRLSPLGLADFHSTVMTGETTNMTQNLTLKTLFFSISLASSNASAEDYPLWTFAKRMLFGFPYPLTSIMIQDTNQTTSNTTFNPLMPRSPSLLSNVPFFHWFDSQTANQFIVDVLEGQIITLLVVVAFILIFLIREWVVQQQPVINMLALGNNAAAQGVADQENEAQQDENVEQFGDEDTDARNDEPEDVDNEVAAPVDIDDRNEPAAEPPRRRATFSQQQHEDLLQRLKNEDLRNGYEVANPALPEAGTRPLQPTVLEKSQEFAHQPPGSAGATVMGLSGGQPQPVDPADAESLGSTQRPLMPSRDRSFIATGIRRSLEEGNEWSFEGVPQAETSQTEHVPNSWEDDERGVAQTAQEQEASSDHEQDSEHSSESWQQITDVMVEDDSDQVLEGERPQDKGNAKTTDLNNMPVLHEDSVGSELPHGEDSIRVETEIDVTSSRITDDNHPSEQPLGNEASAVEQEQRPQVEPVGVQPEPNALHHIVDWMFGDVAPAAETAEELGNDEHIVHNLADEPPFVPFANNEPQEPANPPIQDPEVAAAAAQAGIDLNEQEAIEDAEDLEGILELIGMQGPIVGLFQNVLFSAVLISATLAFAVWLPYLWGKVVLLVMGSPVSLLIKLPLQLVATLTDLLVDFALIIFAGAIYWGSQFVSTLARLCAGADLSATVDGRIATISGSTRSLAEGAMERIADLFMESPLSPRADYFRLSVNSHAALRSLQNSTSSALNETSNVANAVIERISTDSPFKLLWRVMTGLPPAISTGSMVVWNQCSSLLSWIWTVKSYKITLDLDLSHSSTVAYSTMERWTASDRMIAIFAGYAFFAMAGAVYLKRSSPISTSQQGQRIERIVSDVLQQAGGVLKVILIISIEMLAFPLYCGLLLDLAMLPLFKNATLYTRWQFACQSPWTSGFVHWFIGTCYMFHFALFVSMCRKIMRKGVLYFIRDPDDPTFHPVRDVLERSVTTQLRKIAFSALVYGALVIVCLGGVVWSLSRATSNVLPIHWTTEAPSLEFPLDLLFYNFLTPVIIKFYKPSESLHSIYKWWFKKCAGFLRLSNFMFGDKVEEQEGPDGRYVRAPASDQARIPKGQAVFIDVDKDNVRKDGITQGGVHNTDLVAMVFIPSWFRMRILAFVVTIWLFMGISGVSVTILPLLFGRYLFSLILPGTVEMNDIHAFSLGVYTLGSILYSVYHAYRFISSLNRPVPDTMSTLHTVAATTSRIGLRVLRFTYVWASLIFAIPFLFAVLIELYFLMPLHAYLGPAEPHVVHLIQDWTLGFLYSRLAARLVFVNRQSRPARAFNAVIADGYLNPNARIATRCFLLPVLALWAIAIAIPSSLAFTTSRTLYAGASEHTRNMVWRFSFPAVGMSLVVMWAGQQGMRVLRRWRLVVRDEVYLIGERLHNFGEKKAPVQSKALEDAIAARGAEGAGEAVAVA